MFGDDTFEGFSANEQHIKQNSVKVSVRITRIAEQRSCELLQGSGSVRIRACPRRNAYAYSVDPIAYSCVKTKSLFALVFVFVLFLRLGLCCMVHVNRKKNERKGKTVCFHGAFMDI